MNDDDNIQAYSETTDFAAVCACFNLRKAARTAIGIYEEYLRPTGLRVTQLTLLIALDKAGVATITDLSGILFLDRTTLARDLKPLEKLGLVSIAEGEDRRRRMIRLTTDGAEKLKQAIPLWKEAQKHFISDLGAARYPILLNQLSDIIKLRR